MATIDAPTNFKADAGNKVVWLTWSDVIGAEKYKIYRNNKLLVEITVLDNYLDNRVTNGKTYEYIIKASNTTGDSVASSKVTATPTTKKKGIELPPHDLVFPISTFKEKYKQGYIYFKIFTVPGKYYQSIKFSKKGQSGWWVMTGTFSNITSRIKYSGGYAYSGGIGIRDVHGGMLQVLDPELHYDNTLETWVLSTGQNAKNRDPFDPNHKTYANIPSARVITIHPFDISGGSVSTYDPNNQPGAPTPKPIVNSGLIKNRNVIITINDVVKSKYGKFNPPPHNSSRSTSPLLYPSNLGGHHSKIDQTNSRIANAEKFNNRGFIYQDLDSAYGDNGKPKAKKNLWGFEFMYNPTSITSTDQANTAIDYTLQDASFANLLTGSQSFTISILLNRVGDMAALHKVTQAGTSQGYPRPLTAAEIKGIQTRGTEYDLEFLYRVMNGEPATTPSMDMKSSDFGFISGLPIWIRLSNEMNYKGVIAALNVTHAMFTPSMVPMMTQVQITFNRIPVMGFGDNSKAIKKRFTNSDGKSRVPSYTKSTPTTT